MKTKTLLIIMGVILLGFIIYYFIASRPLKVDGYWCKYNATSSVVVILKNDYKKDEKANIESKIKGIVGLDSYDFIEKETLVQETGDALDTFFVYFNSAVDLDKEKEMLGKLNGVEEVKDNDLKSNLKMYYFKNGQFEFYDSIYSPAVNSGTYTKDEKTITLDSGIKLFITKDYICEDESCTTLFTKTNEKCD